MDKKTRDERRVRLVQYDLHFSRAERGKVLATVDCQQRARAMTIEECRECSRFARVEQDARGGPANPRDVRPLDSDPSRPGPRLASAAITLAADWTVTILEVRTSALSYWWVDLIGAGVAALLVATVEWRRDGTSAARPVALASMSGIAVALPLPLAGTVLAVALLVWRMLAFRRRSGRCRSLEPS